MCKVTTNNSFISLNIHNLKNNSLKLISKIEDKVSFTSNDNIKISSNRTSNEIFSKPHINLSNNLNTRENINNNNEVILDLKLDIKDKDGINNFSKEDISGRIKEGSISINKDIFDKAFSSLKGFKSEQGKRVTEIKDVKFDKNDSSYTIDIKVTQNITKSGIPAFWDNFQVKIKTDSNGKLSTKLDKNWIFDSIIMDKLESTVKDKINSSISNKYKGININIQRNKDELAFIPDIKGLEVPISKDKTFFIDKAEASKAKFFIDKNGNIDINLKDVAIVGSTSKTENIKLNEKEDSAEINLKAKITKDNKKEIISNGKININISEKEAINVKVGKEVLGHYLKSAEIENEFDIKINQDGNSKPDIQSKNTLNIKNASFDGKIEKVNISTDLSLKINDKDGITLEPIKQLEKDFKIKTSNNGIQPIIGGANFFNEMSNMIKDAKESVNLETFELKDDKTSNKLTYMLIKKAAGLDTDENKVNISKISSKGIDVKIIFNSWQGNLEEGEKTIKMIERNISKIKEEINTSNLSDSQKKEAIENIEKNMKYKFFTDGLLRSDHRKVFVVDGAIANVGGININDFHLANDSAHDLMIKVAGPEVRNVQKEFLENWHEFNNLEKPKEEDWNKLLKSESFLTNNLNELQKKGEFKSNAKVGTLVTDDFQTDISKGILNLIDSANKEIYIEQAFFTDSKINEKLKEAIKRGVEINVIVAKDSLSAHIFNDGNLYSAYQLLKEQKNGASGKINFYYYQDTGFANKYIHTKGISVDGNKAIIGSANMVGRSLDTPFHKINEDGSKQNIMYNKEMSLYLEGNDAVQDINDKLFKTDIKTKSKLITPNEMEEMVKKAGGEEELRKKFLMAFVT